MKKPAQANPAARIRSMHDALFAAYGPQHWWPAKTPFEVILGAYLTQNTSWKAVERSLENLRAAGALTVAGLRALSLEELQRLIQPSGFYTRKAPSLKAFLALLDAEYNGSLRRMAAAPTETLRAQLLALPGVGQETADAILLYAFGHAVPVADEYLRRIVARHNLVQPHGLASPPNPSQSTAQGRIRYEALASLTREAFAADPSAQQAKLFNEFHALTVAVGKAHCGRTPRCASCPLQVDLQTGERKS
jgi:endonuclease-3 related protein